jgi:hypothetical protein
VSAATKVDDESRAVNAKIAAADATGSASKFKVGSVTVTVPKDDKGDATALNATVGTAVIVPVDSGGAGYTVGDGNTTNATIKYTSGTKELKYKETTPTAATETLDSVFDADIIAVLGALTTGDTVTFGAGGAIANATFASAPADGDAISAVLSGATVVTIGTGADATGIGSFRVPAGKTLEITDAGAEVTVDNTLVVGVTGGQAVTLTKAVITAAAAANATLFNDASSVGTLNLAAGDKVELANGGTIAVEGTAGTITTAAGSVIDATQGSITVDDGSNTVTIAKAVITGGATNTALATTSTAVKVTLEAADTLALAEGGSITIAGGGSVVAGKTTFDGVGAWTATLGADATSITITSAATGATITAPSGTAASTLTASGTAPTITQAVGDGNVLNIGAFITIDLQGTNATPCGRY